MMISLLASIGTILLLSCATVGCFILAMRMRWPDFPAPKGYYLERAAMGLYEADPFEELPTWKMLCLHCQIGNPAAEQRHSRCMRLASSALASMGYNVKRMTTDSKVD